MGQGLWWQGINPGFSLEEDQDDKMDCGGAETGVDHPEPTARSRGRRLQNANSFKDTANPRFSG